MKWTMALCVLLITTTCFAERHKTLEKRISTTPEQRIEIEGFSGSDIRFKSWANNEVYINVRVSMSSSDDEYESEFITSAKISEESTPAKIRLSFDADERHDDGGFSLWKLFKRFYVEKKISGEIYVPRTNPLSTDLKYGSLSLEDMEGDLNLDGVSNSLTLKNCASIKTIENNYGKTVIERSGGDLKLGGTSSTVTITDFDGKVRVDADYSTVTLSGIKKSVSVNDQSGKIKIEDIGGNVLIDANYSNMTVKNISGVVDINSSSATIRVNSVDGISVDANYSNVDITGVRGSAGKQIIVKGQSGSLTLVDAVGDISIDNPYSTIELKNITGNVDLSSKSASITANELKGDWNSRTEYCRIKLRKLTSKTISITNKSDAVDLYLAQAPETINIENEYGGVTVRMPSGFSGTIDLSSEYGNVHTNFSLKQKTRGNVDFATGKVGSGTGSIIIDTKSGDVELVEE